METRRNIKLIVEYDGAGYAGWQIQSGLPTVQGALVEAVRRLTGEEALKLTGASRTDAGVHAAGQTVNFFTATDIPLKGFFHGLNSMLPPDITVKSAACMPPEFDSRKDAAGKKYLYRVFNKKYRSALERGRAWDVFQPLSVEAMQEAAAFLVGKRDFSSFRASDCDAKHPVREITSFEVRDAGGGIIELHVRGTAFLRHMVRIMAGTLVTVGRGRLCPADVKKILDARDRTAAPLTAPPEGLFLMEVEYDLKWKGEEYA